MSEKQREYTKHGEMTRKCDQCKESYGVKNQRQRFCAPECYSKWHSKEKNPASNAKRRNDGKYVWKHIKLRCNDHNSKSYKDYGEKGVQCKFKSFEEFKKVYFRTDNCENCAVPLNDENRRAKDGRNLHRIDSALHYEEKNCMVCCKTCNNWLDKNDKRGWF